MTSTRSVSKVFTSQQTIDGAGVKLRRAFGHEEVKDLDPFLMLDHFGSNDPRDFDMGFPLHPHRGIETVTYVLKGDVTHKDSTGNSGTIGPGDVQWMTAGSGILHEEMPHGKALDGFQLWVNLPRKDKMMHPRYRGILAKDIPKVKLGEGCAVKLIAGRFGNVVGPVRDLMVPVELLDVDLKEGCMVEHPVPAEDHCFAFVYAGNANFGPEYGKNVDREQVAVLADGDVVQAKAGKGGARFLLASGPPLNEPIAWGGPVVMNTREELQRAFQEIDEGRFIK